MNRAEVSFVLLLVGAYVWGFFIGSITARIGRISDKIEELRTDEDGAR